jgi:hypothetical protein
MRRRLRLLCCALPILCACDESPIDKNSLRVESYFHSLPSNEGTTEQDDEQISAAQALFQTCPDPVVTVDAKYVDSAVPDGWLPNELVHNKLGELFYNEDPRNIAIAKAEQAERPNSSDGIDVFFTEELQRSDGVAGIAYQEIRLAIVRPQGFAYGDPEEVLTAAHEIGHLFSLCHSSDPGCAEQDGTGNFMHYNILQAGSRITAAQCDRARVYITNSGLGR